MIQPFNSFVPIPVKRYLVFREFLGETSEELLASCDTLEEAKNLLQEVRQVSPSWDFKLVDHRTMCEVKG